MNTNTVYQGEMNLSCEEIRASTLKCLHTHIVQGGETF